MYSDRIKKAIGRPPVGWCGEHADDLMRRPPVSEIAAALENSGLQSSSAGSTRIRAALPVHRPVTDALQQLVEALLPRRADSSAILGRADELVDVPD